MPRFDPCAPRDGLHAWSQLQWAEWFADIVVSANLQAKHAIHFLVLCGDHNDADVALPHESWRMSGPSRPGSIKSRMMRRGMCSATACRTARPLAIQRGRVIRRAQKVNHDRRELGFVFDDPVAIAPPKRLSVAVRRVAAVRDGEHDCHAVWHPDRRCCNWLARTQEDVFACLYRPSDRTCVLSQSVWQRDNAASPLSGIKKDSVVRSERGSPRPVLGERGAFLSIAFQS